MGDMGLPEAGWLGLTLLTLLRFPRLKSRSLQNCVSYATASHIFFNYLSHPEFVHVPAVC